MNASPTDPSAPNFPRRSLRAVLYRCPAVFIAVLLAVIGLVLAHYFDWAGYVVPFLVPFLPGAVQRTRLRDLVAAMVFAAVSFGLQVLWQRLGAEHLYLLVYLIFPATTMLLAAAMEWWLRGQRDKLRLAAVLATSLAAAAVFAMVQAVLGGMEKTVVLPVEAGWVRQYTLAHLVQTPLLCCLLWLAIPLGLAASARRRTLGLTLSAAAIALYLAFFGDIIFDLASRSLASEGPLAPAAAAQWLARRGTASDYAALWHVVETADWDQPVDYSQRDVRLRCVELLGEDDPAATADRLAKLLLTENKRLLADAAAPLLAQYQHDETAPVLLRFACLGDQTCIAALEQMRVPQVAYALLIWARLETGREYEERAIREGRWTQEVSAKELKLGKALRDKLVPLLGEAKGDTIADWQQHYDQVIDKRPTPLSKTQARDADRVVGAFSKLWSLQASWGEIKQHRVYWTAMKKMKAAGLAKQADLIESSAKANAGKNEFQLPAENSDLGKALAEFDKYIGEARAEIKAPPIDLEARGIDGLERAVADYQRWVSQQHAIEFPPEKPAARATKSAAPAKPKP